MAIVGPTASGKSALAMALAAVEPRVEILSADSMQVYRGMDIGTAKPTAAEQQATPHHLIDLVEASADYGVARFVVDAAAAVAEVRARGGLPVLVGGTGLYVQAVIDALDIPDQFPAVREELDTESSTEALHARLVELDPIAAGRMEPNNRRRVLRALEVSVGSGRPFSSFGPGIDAYPASDVWQIGCDRPRSSLDARIEQRYRDQIDGGFVDEVRRVSEIAGGMSRTARQALGYKELLMYLDGEITLDEAIKLANQRTRRFARRQQRWFRRDPRIEWLDLDAVDLDQIVGQCAKRLRDS